MNTGTTFESWSEAFTASMQDLWFKIADFLPQLLGALLVLIIGLLLASFLAKIVKKILTFTKIDEFFDRMGATEDMGKAGVKTNFSTIIAWLVKWFFIIVTFIAVIDILGIQQLNQFLNDIVLYIPNVLAAIFILAVGLAAGRFIHDLVNKAVLASTLADSVASVLAKTAKWSLMLFALMAALVQLGIADSMIQILFAGLVVALSLALGLSFGLGGKEAAKRLLDRMVK